MPIVFDFNEGISTIATSGTGVIDTLTDGGVTFTVSVLSATGDYYYFAGGSSFPSYPFWFSRGNSGVTGDVFHLDVSGGFTGTASNQIQLAYKSVTGSPQVIFTHSVLGGSQTFTVNNKAGTISTTGNFTGIRFVMNGDGSGSGFSILVVDSLTVNCFVAGTQIATPGGNKSVEALTEGDHILTADGRETRVKWLGERRIEPDLMHPGRIAPVQISAGALGNGLPLRDLTLSPDHAVAIDGTLVNAGVLVNGTTITQDMRARAPFTYYHVETEAHELLLAEGVAAETFIDYAVRDAFDNADQGKARSVQEMPLPRISSARMLPKHIADRLTPPAAA